MANPREQKYPKYGRFVEAEGELAAQLRFLAKAVSKDGTRVIMQHIEVEEVEPAAGENGFPILRGVSTDGRRMHIVDPLATSAGAVYGMTAGSWHVVSCSAKRVQLARLEHPEPFPNWKKVVPSGYPVKESEFEGFSLSMTRLGDTSKALTELLRSFPSWTTINLSFLSDLGILPWKVQWYGADKAVVFVAGCRKAIVMPMARV